MQQFHISNEYQHLETSLSEYLHMSETFQLPALSPSQATPQEMQFDPFSFTPVPFLATTVPPTLVTAEATQPPKSLPQPPKSLPQLLIKHAYKQPKHSTQQSPKSANSSSLHGFRRNSFKQQQQPAYTLPAALQARIMHFQKQKEMLQYQQQQQQQQVQRQHPYERVLSIEIANGATTATATATCPKSAPVVTTTCTPRARCYSLPDTQVTDPAFALLCSFSFDDAVEKTTSPSIGAGVLQEPESLDQMRMQMSFIRGYIDQLKENVK
ncbi:hypothetical protein BJ741DRAFT_663632 [Chytriomyces cf. hyalinus JEL632]|nr:hypothetical protein BJ741DRAFT_663632 [Chytriomyces cf. hyalinus JEL632]